MSVKFNKEKLVDGAKLISFFVIPGSTTSLATGLVRLVVPPGVNIAAQGAMCLGGIILGRYLGKKVTDYVNEQIDETVRNLETAYSEIKKCTDIIQDKDLKSEETEEE